ncbi:D-alanyl-D-alanine carboxypeptidase [Aquamicrobium ahrensii]|uniref:D-alanyl-D-alanine carboxypeptidase/D-alanyl-D-alanine carboxypeptidase (Penicillin-binding protein 5/6) n=1 Tax=Aquamicrobium ahrensii TaxID=469551 RepID=A0ABV2KJ86_9HYPH
MLGFCGGRRVRHFLAALFAAGSIVLGAGVALAETSWAVFDVDSGVFVGEEGGSRIQPPASLAKMMTLYITFEAIRDGRLRWEDRITVSRNASIKIPTKLWVKPGDTISVREAVDGMIVVSANDAAAAMAEYLAGSEAGFARLMTQRARQIGMKDTAFTNPSGLTDGLKQTTTARDMAMLGLALQRDFPKEYRLFAQPSFVFRGKLRKGHNNLMYRYGGVDGIKTGYTDAAGYNLASSLNLNGHRLIGVVLGGKTARARDNQMASLLTRFSKGTGVETPLVAMNAPVPTPRPAVEIAMHMPEIEQGDGGFPVPSLTGWQIQIAALPNRNAAQFLLDKVGGLVRSIHTGALAQIEPTTRSGRTLYRARFEGFEDQAAATRACAVLKSNKLDCITVEVP